MEPEVLDKPTSFAELGPDARLPVQADYFAFGETFKCYLPDGISYLEHKSLNEGARRRYLNMVNREVTLERGSGNARMKLASGDEKHFLLEEAIVGWNLKQGDKDLGFSKGNPGSTLSQFLAAADPSIIDIIEKDVRKHNKWLLNDVTVEGIDEQIADLQEMRDDLLKEQAGNSTSSPK